jgi:hypothetical protein
MLAFLFLWLHERLGLGTSREIHLRDRILFLAVVPFFILNLAATNQSMMRVVGWCPRAHNVFDDLFVRCCDLH